MIPPKCWEEFRYKLQAVLLDFCFFGLCVEMYCLNSFSQNFCLQLAWQKERGQTSMLLKYPAASENNQKNLNFNISCLF